MKKYSRQFFISLLLALLLCPQLLLAATANNRLRNVVTAKPTYDYDKTTKNTLTEYIGAIIAVFLGLLGVIFVFLIIYAGYTWMTAAGNVEKVERAQRTIKYAIIGLLVIIAVYAIWVFLLVRVVQL